MAKFETLAPRIMRDLMRDFPIDKLDAAAVCGNIGHETNGLTVMQEVKPSVPGSRGGYGWPQWTGPRRRAFEAWCKARGLKVDSYEANYGFMAVELRGDEKAALAALKRADDLAAKTVAFEAAYERAGVTALAARIRWAKRALAAFEAAQGVNPKPLRNSRTIAGGAAGAAAGAGAIVDAVTTARDGAQQARDAWSTGEIIGIVVGVLALIAAAIVIYARWDDAGRPTPWRGGDVAPVDDEAAT